MGNYEMVHEILNQCPNNQMRDVYFQEVQTDDPQAFVWDLLKRELTELQTELLSDGSMRISVCCDGLNHRFLFTPD